jgi:putative transposase
MKTLDPGVARVLKRLHYPLEVILTCVHWHVACPMVSSTPWSPEP